ncbi:hypothetical protein ABEG75_15730 [Pantoea agglomerans]|uniref:hypothetical protein n=1 Tax=Enterobacter agglomerans TaxID=549 RepID=UPI0004D87483|nr:hypothetical protein [Pantoea agglomerans]KEY42478.1 hypothetical protein FB99_09300 [Pantoea agglomerans]QAV43989.1 hypothetical protein D1629_04855 [Pantoea agglomerans]QAV48829.1 hypothetical protein D1628_05865 [Pantoea agglomerans]
MRLIFTILLFVFCAIAISKAIAVIVPVTFFYAIAGFLNINGDEATLDFVLSANILISIIMSVALLWVLKGFFKKH